MTGGRLSRHRPFPWVAGCDSRLLFCQVSFLLLSHPVVLAAPIHEDVVGSYPSRRLTRFICNPAFLVRAWLVAYAILDFPLTAAITDEDCRGYEALAA